MGACKWLEIELVFTVERLCTPVCDLELHIAHYRPGLKDFVVTGVVVTHQWR